MDRFNIVVVNIALFMTTHGVALCVEIIDHCERTTTRAITIL